MHPLEIHSEFTSEYQTNAYFWENEGWRGLGEGGGKTKPSMNFTKFI